MPRVAVVGGGPNGVITANLLIDSGIDDLHIQMFGHGKWGHGLVYGEKELASARQSFTNQNMGVAAKDEEALLDWINQNRSSLNTVFPEQDLQANSFPPRKMIGYYFADQIDWAKQQAKEKGVRLDMIQERIISAENKGDGYHLASEKGQFQADVIFFCLGNFPPSWGSHLSGSPNYHPEIWGQTVLEEVGKYDDVLIIGSGLSSIDLLWGLEDRGHQGAVVFASRNGILPSVQADYLDVYLEDFFDQLLGEEVISFERFKDAIWQEHSQKVGRPPWPIKPWYDFDPEQKEESYAQAMVRLIGERMPCIWARMNPEGKQQFDYQLGAWWNSMHLPMAKHSARLLREEIDRGRLRVEKLNSVEAKQGQGFVAHFEEGSAHFKHCFNATGRNLDTGSIQDPLVKSILRSELFIPDPSGGFVVNPDTAQSTTTLGRGCYMIGPLTRGSCFYTYVLSQNAQQAMSATQHWAASFRRFIL